MLPSLPRPVRIQLNISALYAGPWTTSRPIGSGHQTKATVPTIATVAAHHSIARTAPPRSPLRSRWTSTT